MTTSGPVADDASFRSLFNGRDLTGWVAMPRRYDTLWPGGPTPAQAAPGALPDDYNEQAARHPAAWTVEDDAIVGRQSPPGSGWGGFLVTEETFGDFELILETRLDWPADSGIYLRKRAFTTHAVQVVLDHRKSGGIGGFYGNGIGGFHAIPFTVDAEYDANRTPTGLCADSPDTALEPFSPEKRSLLSAAASVEDFLDCWRFLDWNEVRVRAVGAQPRITTWINGLLIAELDMATLQARHYDADAVAELLGPRGHIALEVHDNDPWLGDARWAPEAACSWRNIRIKEL